MQRSDLTPEVLHALRRVDWRFLLTRPAIGQVAVLASPLADEPDRTLLAGLGQVADMVEVLSGPHQVTERHDLLIARNPTPRALRAVAESLHDDAQVYIELQRDRRASRLRGLAPWKRALADAGVGTAFAHWHHPGFDAAEIVPLTQASARMALARRRGSRIRSLAAGGARRLPGAHVGLARTAPAVSLLAGPRRGAEDVGAWLMRAGPPTRLALQAEVPWLLVTPRFATSRHVVLVAGSVAAGADSWVAKTPRVADDVAALTHEADILGALATRIGEKNAFPTLLSFDAGPPAVLVETAIVGRPLDPLEVRRDPIRALRLGMDWVRTVAAAAGPAEGGRWATRVRASLRRLAETPFVFDRDAISRAERVLDRLDAVAVPSVIEHGDMAHPNLVIQRDRLALIDWELGIVDGCPLADLAFFIGYLAFATARATTAEDHGRALHAALSPDGWGMRALRQHARDLGLPDQVVGPLVLAAWTRYTAMVAQRVVSDNAAASVQVARFSAAWHEVLASVEAIA